MAHETQYVTFAAPKQRASRNPPKRHIAERGERTTFCGHIVADNWQRVGGEPASLASVNREPVKEEGYRLCGICRMAARKLLRTA